MYAPQIPTCFCSVLKACFSESQFSSIVGLPSKGVAGEGEVSGCNSGYLSDFNCEVLFSFPYELEI